jgi:hypothetical protein
VVQFPSQTKFSLLQSVQMGSAAHPTTCSIGKGDISLGRGGQGVKLTALLHRIPTLKIRRVIIHFPLCLFGEVTNRDDFTHHTILSSDMTIITKLGNKVRRSLKNEGNKHSDAKISIPTLKCRWHMGIRWYTPNLCVVASDI